MGSFILWEANRLSGAQWGPPHHDLHSFKGNGLSASCKAVGWGLH